MKAIKIAFHVAVSCVMAALLFASEASAQMYRPESFDPGATAPSLLLGLSPGAIQELNRDQDVLAFQVFGGGRRLDRLSVGNGIDRPGPWVLYGRFYLLNFQNQLTEEPGVSVGFKRTGPTISGRIYVGIRKRF
jgi:hypothetical protein